MTEHLDDRHTFTVEWDEDGKGIDRTLAEVEGTLIGYREALPAQKVSEILAREVEEVDPLPAPPREREFRLSEQGGIRFDEVTAEQCGICRHPWHTGICTRQFQAGEHMTECGCETAAP